MARTPNGFRLTVHLVNPDKSKYFQTTKTYYDIPTVQDAIGVMDRLYGREGIFFPKICMAYYSGHLLVSNGFITERYKDTIKCPRALSS